MNPARSVAVLLLIAFLMGSIAMPIAPALAAGTSPDFAQIDLHPNIETIGVVVSGSNLPDSATLLYSRSGDSTWLTGHPLKRIDDGRLVGSLFGLSPATAYTIKVQDGSGEISGSVTTQPDELVFIPSAIIHVNDDAPAGGDGSTGAPFKTIQEGVDHAAPGTQVLVADGIYFETVTFPASGSPGTWIQVKAAGTGAILEGSENRSGDIWTPVDGKKNVWFNKIGGSTAYLARDQQRYYQYDDFSGLSQARGHNGVPVNEGWFYEPGTQKLYVRSLDNPAQHTWHIARLNHAFNTGGQDWVWIEGFEMRYYGIGDGCGVCMKNSSHVVVRRNRIHNIQKGVFFEWTGGEDRGNDTRVELNEIYDPPVNEWAWSAVKGTSMEGTAITIRGHIGAIVRGNDVHNFFNGIFAGSSGGLENPGIAFDADVYNNNIHSMGDDAFEPEGACINVRFRNNTASAIYVGVSLAPITTGPTWVTRSVFGGYTGRAIKWDRNSDGVVLIYHNTFWTGAGAPNSMDLISPASNAIMRNNIIQGNALSISEVPIGSTGNDWNYDNWYTSLGAGSPHFKWENVNYSNLAALCASTGLECNGHDGPPGLANPAAGDFNLTAGSPNVDRAALIPGINDIFAGRAPDVGAYEFALDAAPSVRSITRLDVNPTNAGTVSFSVVFSEPVTGVDVAVPFNDFALDAGAGISGAAIDGVTAVSGTTYTVNVGTGTGNGSLGLHLVDNDSIVDAAANPLGGAGAGNGSHSGETYTVEKDHTFVTSILRMDPDPSGAASVRYAVTFSGAVTAVDATDFAVTPGGGISGTSVATVSGGGDSYTVSVNTGTGDGTLRLDLLDNDSILDSLGNPVGGAGAGNGNFTAGETYTLNKGAPTVVGSARADADPTAAASVRFTVSFSEIVSGVDATDFAISTSGGIAGAGISGVSGAGSVYTVTLSTGSGNGTLRLDVIDNDSILDAGGLPLGGAGAGNGGFTGGQTYSVNKNVNIVSINYTSNGTADGWVLESSEDRNRGGSGNSNAATFSLGDDAGDRQYRGILHFPTSSLPDNAVVTLVILSIKFQGSTGTNPFTSHQNVTIDIKSGFFGSAGLFGFNSLDLTDFQSAASRNSVGTIFNNPVGGWYWASLDPASFPHVNRTGVTQFRLYFQLDDNDDLGEDLLRFHSGNAKLQADRPLLHIEYYVP